VDFEINAPASTIIIDDGEYVNHHGPNAVNMTMNINDLPKYNGEVAKSYHYETNIEDFITKYETLADAAGWSDAQKKNNVVARLEGTPYTQFKEMQKKYHEDMQTWKGTKKALRWIQEKKQNIQTLIAQIQATKMKDNDFDKYEITMNQLFQKAKLSEAMQIMMFKNGLPKKIQDFLLLKQPSNYDNMVLAVRQFIGDSAVFYVGKEEKKQEEKHNKKKYDNKPHFQKKKYCAHCKTETHNTADCRYKKNTSQIKTEEKDTKEVVCFGCGETGHIRPKCPRAQRNQKSFNTSNANVNTVPCDTCKKTNHKTEDCFFNLLKNMKQSQNMTAVNKMKTPLMNIAIDSQGKNKIAFLPDTGAARTMIPVKVFKDLGLKYSTFSTPHLTHAGNTALNLLGMTDLTLYLGEEEYHVSAAVADGAIPFSLLGRDVLETYNLFAGKINGKWILTDNMIPDGNYKTNQVSYQCAVLDEEINAQTKKIPGCKPQADEVYYHQPVLTTTTFFSGGCTQPKSKSDIKYCDEFIADEEDQRGLDKPVAVKFASDTSAVFNKKWFDDMEKIAKTASGIPVKIETTGEIIKQRPYGGSRRKEELVKLEVDKLLQKGFVEKSTAAGCAPVILVKKPMIDPNNTLEKPRYRMVEDYRQLNEVTIKNAGTLPNIDKLFDKIQGKRYYVLIDLVDAFYHVKISEDSKPKTAFVTENGLYQFTRLPQGWTNSPQIFQDKVQEILEEGKEQKEISDDTWNFVDDIIMAGDDLKELKYEVERLVKYLASKGLVINVPKSSFGVTECRYLGYELSHKGRALNEQIITKIEKKLSALLNGREIDSEDPEVIKNQAQKIVGLVNFYRKFIRKTSEKTQFLTAKIKNPTPFTQKQKEKIIELFEELNNKKYIASIQPKTPLRIYTDASDQSAGYVAIQGKSVVDLDSARFQSEA